jgi:plastocyanin
MGARSRRARHAPALLVVCAATVAGAVLAPASSGDEPGRDPVADRGDRYMPKPVGTVEKLEFFYGPYPLPAGWDANRVDLELPVQNGMIISIEPSLRLADGSEPAHQIAHIHHAHWFALDPGNEEDNYTRGNSEWIFGNGDEETRADFGLRSAANPKGPVYGQYIGTAAPQAMIFMLHNKTAQNLLTYVVLEVTFKHGTLEQLNKTGRPHHDLAGVLFGRTFDVQRQPKGDGRYETTKDSKRPIEWTATVDGTMIGTGSHLHPGGQRVIVENMGSTRSPCPNDRRGYGGTQLLHSDVLNRRAPYSEDFQMEVTRPSWRAPVRKGDRIRITGVYENKSHAWYDVMTHEGIYIDERQPPKGRCKPYLVGKDAKRKVRPRLKNGKLGKARRLDPAAGVPNRAWSHHADSFCGVKFGADPCEPPFKEMRAPGPIAERVAIADFVYTPGDRYGSGDMARPPTVKKGTSLTFVNVDQQANIRHTVTTCRWPCNGSYVSNYPWADGRWDSGTLGYDAISGGTPNPVASTPKDLPVGKYAYFCRIHPWMRGEFRVVP